MEIPLFDQANAPAAYGSYIWYLHLYHHASTHMHIPYIPSILVTNIILLHLSNHFSDAVPPLPPTTMTGEIIPSKGVLQFNEAGCTAESNEGRCVFFFCAFFFL